MNNEEIDIIEETIFIFFLFCSILILIYYSFYQIINNGNIIIGNTITYMSPFLIIPLFIIIQRRRIKEME